MAAGEDDRKREQGKGFAGLSSLLSDVDTTFSSAAEKPPASPSANPPGTSRSAPQAAPSRPQPVPQQSSIPPQQPGSSSTNSKWVWGINAVIIIGALWLMGQSTKNASTPTSAYSPPVQSTTPSYSAPPQSQVPSPGETSTNSSVMSDGKGATYSVPSYRLAELNASEQAARSAQQRARELDAQVDSQKILLDDEERRVEQYKEQLDALGNEIEQQRSLVDSTNQYELDAFNSKVNEYNTERVQVQRRIHKFNIDVDAYNNLVQRARIQEQQANNMVDVYNSKLEQYGTRQ